MPEYLAIGDIHGCRDMLDILLSRLPAEGTLVFLGDYIDRGPDARGVIDRLIALRDERPCIFLRGNHEAMALCASRGGDDRATEMWRLNGGVETLQSYGDAGISSAHLAFFEQTLPYLVTDDYIFVHGGLRPGYQPAEMREDELWWLRETFLASDYDWGRLVIHGHSPVANGRPDVRNNRINIDTAAVFGGRLTALLLPEKRFIQVKYGERPKPG